MSTNTTSSDFYTRLHRVVSKPRFEAYKNGGTDHQAFCRYIWNTAICESLYPSFQILEVSYRNALHIELGNRFSEPDWLLRGPLFLSPREQEIVDNGKTEVNQKRGKCTEPLLVAELKFGFWTSLLDSRYDTMWPKIIATVFSNMPKTGRTRGTASAAMNRIRKFRNAALHHHSIWHWSDIREQHQEMHTIIAWISNEASSLAKQMDRFPDVYSKGPANFEHIAAKLAGISN